VLNRATTYPELNQVKRSGQKNCRSVSDRIARAPNIEHGLVSGFLRTPDT